MNFNLLRRWWDREQAIETHNCPICFDNIEQLYTKWTCNHYFHEECINTWNHSCPSCRNTNRLIQPNEPPNEPHNESSSDRPKNNIMDVSALRSLIQVPMDNRNMYLTNWGKPDCVDNNHELLILQPYGVMVICVNCNLIKTFNRLH